MESEKSISVNEDEELVQSYRASVLAVGGFILLTILLVAIAFLATNAITRLGDPWLVGALRIAILVFGLGAIVLRRTKFARMRLLDIAGVRGITGLVHSLRGGTTQLASIGGAISMMGFIGTIRSGDPFEMLRAGVVALAVLLYSFPRKGAWMKLVEDARQQTGADAATAEGTTS